MSIKPVLIADTEPMMYMIKGGKNMTNYYQKQIDSVLADKKPFGGLYHMKIKSEGQDQNQTNWMSITPKHLRELRKIVGRRR